MQKLLPTILILFTCRISWIIISTVLIIQPVFLSCSKDIIITDDKKKHREIGLVIFKYRSGNWEERIEAINEISSYDKLPESIPALRLLVEATYDNHSAVTIEAIKKLAAFPSVISKTRLSELSSDDRNLNIKWYALSAMSTYRDPDLAEIFIKGLESSDWLIRDISIKSILMLNSELIKKSYIKYAIIGLRDQSNTVKLTTLSSLSIKDDKIYTEVIDILKKQNLKNVFRKASLKALKGYRLDEKTKEFIINLLTDSNMEIRVLALRLLKDHETMTEK